MSCWDIRLNWKPVWGKIKDTHQSWSIYHSQPHRPFNSQIGIKYASSATRTTSLSHCSRSTGMIYSSGSVSYISFNFVVCLCLRKRTSCIFFTHQGDRLGAATTRTLWRFQCVSPSYIYWSPFIPTRITAVNPRQRWAPRFGYISGMVSIALI